MGVCANQVVELETSNRQHRLMIQLGVVKSVEKMNSTRTRGSQTHSEPARELGVSTCHECGGFLVAYLDEADLVLAIA